MYDSGQHSGRLWPHYPAQTSPASGPASAGPQYSGPPHPGMRYPTYTAWPQAGPGSAHQAPAQGWGPGPPPGQYYSAGAAPGHPPHPYAPPYHHHGYGNVQPGMASGQMFPYHAQWRLQESPKEFVVAWLLSYFFGVFGIDRFYQGFIGLGVLKLLTCGGAGIWALIDLLIILSTGGRDSDGRPLANYRKYKTVAWILTGVLMLMGFIGILLSAATA